MMTFSVFLAVLVWIYSFGSTNTHLGRKVFIRYICLHSTAPNYLLCNDTSHTACSFPVTIAAAVPPQLLHKWRSVVSHNVTEAVGGSVDLWAEFLNYRRRRRTTFLFVLTGVTKQAELAAPAFLMLRSEWGLISSVAWTGPIPCGWVTCHRHRVFSSSFKLS